jgi:hypothetical protein
MHAPVSQKSPDGARKLAGSAGDSALRGALAKMAASVAARQTAERERAEVSAQEQAERARREAAAARRFVRVPNALLGKVFDGGRASAYAAHLLAIKVLHGSGRPWALNETHVACTYGIGRRGFRLGIARLRDKAVGAITADAPEPAGAIRRGQPGPREGTRGWGRWAASAMTEILQAGACRWVPLPSGLLGDDSFVVAMILAVLLSPKPVRPADAAARFGVTSPATIRRLAQAAVRSGAVAETRGPRNAIMLGRPPLGCQAAETHPAPAAVAGATSVSGRPAADLARNVPAKNVPRTIEGRRHDRRPRLTPPAPHAAGAARGEREGVKDRDEDRDTVIELLRQEGQPAAVVDLLAWLLAEGLRWWTCGPERIATARRLCAELRAAPARAVASVRYELRSGRTPILPPAPAIVGAVRKAAAELEERSDDAVAIGAVRRPTFRPPGAYH